MHTKSIELSKQTNLRPYRPTIGLLTELHSDSIFRDLWVGADDATRAQDANLLCIPVSGRDPYYPFALQEHLLHKLVKAGGLDGLIIVMEWLKWAIPPGQAARFCDQFRQIPRVSIMVAVEGVPSVLVDFATSMRAMLAHFIEVHGYRRIAFIQGPATSLPASIRDQVYREVLPAYGLPLRPELIAPGDYERASGAAAIQCLIDERQVDFDAIIAANDGMALGALDALCARGKRVPHDVALAGFDDLTEARCVTPPLTTGHHPFYELGRQAAEIILAQLAGREVPSEVILPMDVIIRQSCGCRHPALLKASVPLPERSSAIVLTTQRTDLPRYPDDSVIEEQVSPLIEELEHLFQADLQTDTGMFVSRLEDLLQHTSTSGGEVNAWQDVLSGMRHRLLSRLDTPDSIARAEHLWHQARVMIGEIAERMRGYQAVQVEQQAQRLQRLEQALMTTFDVAKLMDVLADGLPRLGIPSAYLALYVDPQVPEEWVNLMLAYTDQTRLELPAAGQPFPTYQSAPLALLPQPRRYSLILERLYFQQDQIGAVLFEAGPRDGGLYEALQGEISSALQGALAEQKLLRYRDHLEHLVNERTAELTRMNAQLYEEILERRRIAHALQTSEEQYRLLAENVRDGIVIIQEGKLTFANQIFASMTGRTPEQLAMLEPAHLFSPEDREHVHARLIVKTDAVQPSTWQTQLLTPDGDTCWIEIEQSPITWNSQPGLLLTVRNIADRKLREQRLEEERARLEEEYHSLRSTISERYRFGSIVGKSAAMQRVYDLIVSAANSEVNVLVSGESGTGKELIARTFHQVSRRKAQPFVPVNCASIPETLFEREFFGHRKGAFTGADRDTPGLFDRAHRGVLFLDEVTELSPNTQAKLLRVLQDGDYTPLGSATPKQADVVIVAATNIDYQAAIKQGRLRKDFFYRIGVIEIPIPPLCERKDDLPLLISHILAEYQQKQAKIQGSTLREAPLDHMMLPGELIQSLYAYDWPGNIRELQNVLQRYLVTGDLGTVLPLLGVTANRHAITPPTADSANRRTLPEAIATLEQQMIATALTETGGHVEKAAELLDLPRSSLYRKIKEYGVRV